MWMYEVRVSMVVVVRVLRVWVTPGGEGGAPLQEPALRRLAQLLDDADPEHVQHACLRVRHFAAGHAGTDFLVCRRRRALGRRRRHLSQHLHRLRIGGCTFKFRV